MRRSALRSALCVLTALATLGGCKREPSFDERYAGARKEIGEKAGELDADMSRRASEGATEDAAEVVVPGKS